MAARSAGADPHKHFGRVMRLFAPLYLSNECINNCKYCGFSRDNPILRVTLPVDAGRRRGAAPRTRRDFATCCWSRASIRSSCPTVIWRNASAPCASEAGVPGVSLEVGPMETDEYRPLVAAGAEGLVVYQETYHRADLRGDAHRRAEARFRLAARLPRARLRGRVPAARASARCSACATGARKPWRWPRTSIICCAIAGRRTSPSACRACGRRRGGSSRAIAFGDRELVQLLCALRADFPADRPRAFHPRGPRLARRPDPARRDDHERRQPHRAGRLHRRGPRRPAPHRARAGVARRRRRAGAPARRRRASSTSPTRAARARSPDVLRARHGLEAGVEGLGRGARGRRLTAMERPAQISVVLNGERRTVPAGTGLIAFIESLGVAGPGRAGRTQRPGVAARRTAGVRSGGKRPAWKSCGSWRAAEVSGKHFLRSRLHPKAFSSGNDPYPVTGLRVDPENFPTLINSDGWKPTVRTKSHP